MSSLKITAALLTFAAVMQAHAIYITTSTALAKPAAPRAKGTKVAANPFIRSYLEASADSPESFSVTTAAPVESAVLTIPNSASNLIIASKFFPAKEGFVQYVPEPSSMVVISFAGLLPFFRRRRQ
jgi:hypothetical protein